MSPRALKKKRRLRLRRITNRRYADPDPETGGVRPILISHAVYELIGAEGRLARIIRGPEGWRVCRLTNTGSSFGLPVSPVGMNRFRDVKAWALANLVKQES
jgi:hypothetical protein